MTTPCDAGETLDSKCGSRAPGKKRQVTLLEARGLRERPTRAIDRLRSARDRARALLTVPRLPAPVSDRSAPARPVVDIGLWTVHVAYADRHEPVHFDRLVGHYRLFATATAKRLYRRGEPSTTWYRCPTRHSCSHCGGSTVTGHAVPRLCNAHHRRHRAPPLSR
jgi:hypothetical protein